MQIYIYNIYAWLFGTYTSEGHQLSSSKPPYVFVHVWGKMVSPLVAQTILKDAAEKNTLKTKISA